MEEWVDNSYNELLNECAESVEKSNEYNELIKEILNDLNYEEMIVESLNRNCEGSALQFAEMIENNSDNTYVELLNAVENNQSFDVMIVETLRNEEINNTVQNNSEPEICGVKMDYQRISQILFHASSFIADIEEYTNIMKRYMLGLIKIAYVVEQEEKYNSKGIGPLMLNESNYNKMEMSLNTMNDMLIKQCNEARESDKILKEMFNEQFIKFSKYLPQ